MTVHDDKFEMTERRTESRDRLFATEIEAIRHELRRLQGIVDKCREDSAEALRIAEGSSHQLKSTGDALIRHVDQAVGHLQADALANREVVESMNKSIQALLQESRDREARKQARSQVSLEHAAQEAMELEKAQRRKRHLTWMLGIAFAVLQLVEIGLNLLKPVVK